MYSAIRPEIATVSQEHMRLMLQQKPSKLMLGIKPKIILRAIKKNKPWGGSESRLVLLPLSVMDEDEERHHCGGFLVLVLQEPHLVITNSQLLRALL